MFLATTILALKHKGEVVIAGDGQVTLDKTIVKSKAKKVRTMRDGKVIGGFAGSAADGITLYEKFEKKLDEYHGNLTRAAVELAKEWRTDKVLRKLEALMIVGDMEHLYILSGNGDIIEPDDQIAAIGSGASYALASAKALVMHSNLNAEEIVKISMEIANSICIYTNNNIIIEKIK